MSDPVLDSFFGAGRKKTWEPPTAPPVHRTTVDSLDNEWLASLPSHEYMVGGVVKRFYTIGILARVLQRTPVTIRSWERKGWLPKATFRTPAPAGEQIPGKAVKGRRLYSEAQLQCLYEAHQRFSLDDPYQADWKGFRNYIKHNYPLT